MSLGHSLVVSPGHASLLSVFPASILESAISQRALVPFIGGAIRDQELGARCAPWYRVGTTLSKLSSQLFLKPRAALLSQVHMQLRDTAHVLPGAAFVGRPGRAVGRGPEGHCSRTFRKQLICCISCSRLLGASQDLTQTPP